MVEKYHLDRKAMFVPTLYTNSSSSEYYEWEDAILDFYYSGELPASQLVNLAKQTFSNHLLQWWLKFQQSLIYDGEKPCTSWVDMRVVLQCRYDPSIDDICLIKKAVARGGQNSLSTKSEARSAWAASIIDAECHEQRKQHGSASKSVTKKKAAGSAQNYPTPTKQRRKHSYHCLSETVSPVKDQKATSVAANGDEMKRVMISKSFSPHELE